MAAVTPKDGPLAAGDDRDFASPDSRPGDEMAHLTERATTIGRTVWSNDWYPDRRAVAPGRIELLGNHIDYSGGQVLAAAIDRYAVLVGASEGTGDAVGFVYADPSGDGIQHHRFTIEELDDWRQNTAPDSPADYLRGVAASLLAAGLPLDGARQIALAGNIPMGMGVSSSAALVVGLTLTLTRADLSDHDRILIAQGGENRAGVMSGTMDQAASVAGGAILYDAGAVSFERLTPDLGDVTFAVISSGVEHRLGESKYSERVRETRDVLAIARRRFGDDALPGLAALTTDQLAELVADGALDPTQERRARHVVSEVGRVADGYRAIQHADWPTFGQLMHVSGRSSATDYDISHPQVEDLVAEVRKGDGVLGARMMGGGSGGSILALLERDAIRRLTSTLEAGYFRRHGLSPANDLLTIQEFAQGASARDLA